MKLSKRLRKWKANLMTQTPVEYVLTLRADVNGFADEVKALERENDKLRELVREIWQDLNAATQYDAGGGRGIVFEFKDKARKLGVEVGE